jgi:hypothetical protein
VAADDPLALELTAVAFVEAAGTGVPVDVGDEITSVGR